MSSNGRVRWARSSITGSVPATLPAGAMAVNWADKKIYVGDGASRAVRFSQWLDDWSGARTYLTGDFAVRQGDIWRAVRDIPTGSAFDPDDWERLTSAGALPALEPVSTDIYSGGQLSLLSPTTIQIAAGEGIIVDNTAPGAPLFTVVAWPTFNVTPSVPAAGWSIFAINATGAVSTFSPTAWTESARRSHIGLGYAVWDAVGIERVFDGSRRAGGTAETYLDEYIANGGAYRTRGVAPLANAGTLTLALTEGEVFAVGAAWRSAPAAPNRVDVPAQATLSFYRVSTVGIEAGPVTTIDPEQYDAAGVLTAVPAGQATIQYIYANQQFDAFFVQYGQNVYADVLAAAARLEADFATLTQVSQVPGLSLIGAAIVQQGIANLDSLSTSRIVNASSGAAPFSNSGVADDSDYYLLDGSRALTGDLDAGGFDLTNARVDGDGAGTVAVLLDRSATTGAVPATTAPADAGEVTVNYTDLKVYARNAAGAAVLVADRVSNYDPARQYVVSDMCFFDPGGGVQLYRCNTGIPVPEAFNAGKWDVMGGGTPASLAGAVVLDPETPARNIVDTIGFPAVEALRVRGDPAQSEALLIVEGTQAGDTGAAGFDALGFPMSRNGAASWRQGAPTHPFTAIGQPAHFNGSAWVRATTALGVDAVVQEIIDVNTIVLRSAGLVVNLAVGAFAGSIAPSPGATYYTSGTAGVLTAVAGGAPVLRAVSATQGVLLIGAAPTYATAGPTFPVAPVPGQQHYMTEDPVGMFMFYDDGDTTQWVQTNGSGTQIALPYAYHDPAGLASWRVDPVSMTLECWGSVVALGVGSVISFPKTFALPPAVTTSGASTSTSGAPRVVQAASVSETQFTAFGRGSGGAVDASGDYHAIGKWDGAS